MSRLPDADCRSVCLHLVNITSFDPNRLPLHDGLLNNRRLLDDHGLLDNRRRRHDRRSGLLNDHGISVIRTRQGRSNHPTDHSADKTWPEAPAARPPVTVMMMVMMVAAVPAVMNRRRMVEAAVMVSSVPTTRERAGRNCHEGDC